MVAALIHLELLVDGLRIMGDAQASGHAGQIEVLAFHWSAAAAHLPAVASTGRRANPSAKRLSSGSGGQDDWRQGEFRLGQLHLRKAWDRSSAVLAQAVADGARADRAVLTVSRPRPSAEDADLLPIMVLELTDAALLDLHGWSEDAFPLAAGARPGEPLAGDALILRQQLTLGGPKQVRLSYFAPPIDSWAAGPSDAGDAPGAALTVQLSSTQAVEAGGASGASR